MQKLCIFALLIPLLLIAQFCSAGYDEGKNTTVVKTGDIEVTAKGCKLPPYKVGLKLDLNKMPEMTIPDWVKPYPLDSDEQEVWVDETLHRLSREDRWVINYIYDSLGIKRLIIISVIFYGENKIAEGLTDSMGHYTFKDVPVGRYQVVCYPERLPPELMDAEDSLLYCLKPLKGDGEKGLHGETRREPGAIDFVRVAPDSVSIVSVSAFHASSSFAYINHVGNWQENFKKRKGDNNGNDQNIKQDSNDYNMRGDKDTIAEKTGDIEVTAIGIKLPPYKVGLKIELNKMPEMVIPDWVKPYPQDSMEQKAWLNETLHRLGREELWVINYIYDSLGINRQVIRPVIFYDENKIAEGLTDSMGRYTFKNVPVGRYQVVCYPEKLPPELMDAEDSLLYCLKPIKGDGEKGPHGESHREPGAIDFVRVAQDSISIVSVSAFQGSGFNVKINHVGNWKDKFKNRKSDKNGNDQNIKQDSNDYNMPDDN